MSSKHTAEKCDSTTAKHDLILQTCMSKVSKNIAFLGKKMYKKILKMARSLHSEQEMLFKYK